ncbi:MAG: hypothetical protein V3W41_07060 [Planctomycetota bacterium]
MKIFSASLLVALTYLMLSPFALGDDDDAKGETIKLKFKAVQKWNIVLPNEEFTKADGKIAIPHANGDGFVTELDGMSLAIDSNGDGKVDTKAKGVGGFATLKGKNANGAKFRYAIRLVNNGGWQYATSGTMNGKLGGQAIRLIDQNNNGIYNEYGKDAMVIGKSKTASFLSKVVSVKGKLFNIEVSADGRQITATSFTGETGTMNLAKNFESKGAKLVAAVVKSDDGEISFNLAGAQKGLLVPAGSYELVSGLIAKGRESAKVKGGDRSMKVTADGNFELTWGGPLRAEFEYDMNGTEVTLSPEKVWYYGQAGEEYYDWIPKSVSPKFTIRDAMSKREISDARFGGS